MINTRTLVRSLLACTLLPLSLPVLAAGDAERGERLYRVCAGCHSLEPGRHRAGPSLARIFGRKAGTVEGFMRYSKALKESDVVWNEKTLDAWLKEPDAVIPENLMPFPGIGDADKRRDLVAFLKDMSADNKPAAPSQTQGMMGEPQLSDVKQLPRRNQVKAIRYCPDSYFVTVASGETLPFWEFNLRFKTDSDPATGPSKGKPVIIGVGMRGDRAAIVFSDPGEISRFTRERCE